LVGFSNAYVAVVKVGDKKDLQNLNSCQKTIKKQLRKKLVIHLQKTTLFLKDQAQLLSSMVKVVIHKTAKALKKIRIVLLVLAFKLTLAH